MSSAPAAVVIVLLGAYKTKVFGQALYWGWRSGRWPRANAHIVESSMAVSGTSGRRSPVQLMGAPTIEYKYKLEGTVYEGDQVAFGPLWWWLSLYDVHHYRAGSSAEVAYDPALPARSVLCPGVTLSTAFGLPIGVTLLIVGLTWLARSMLG